MIELSTNLYNFNDWYMFLKQREPLAAKVNQSAIPKPSRLMQPGMLAATRKRPAQASVEPQDKEVDLISLMHKYQNIFTTSILFWN